MDKAFHGLTAEEQLDMVSTCPECREKRAWEEEKYGIGRHRIGSGGVGD
jgi:hypothetical protein